MTQVEKELLNLWDLNAEKFVQRFTSVYFDPALREAFYQSLPFGPEGVLPDYEEAHPRLAAFLEAARRIREIALNERLELLGQLIQKLEQALQGLEGYKPSGCEVRLEAVLETLGEPLPQGEVTPEEILETLEGSDAL
jgi:hypothetical protein